MSSNNTLKGVAVTDAAQWRAYDALPARLREVFARAPYDYAMPTWSRKLRASLAGGASPWSVRDDLIMTMASDLQRRAAKDYGPDHPDARWSRPVGREGGR